MIHSAIPRAIARLAGKRTTLTVAGKRAAVHMNVREALEWSMNDSALRAQSKSSDVRIFGSIADTTGVRMRFQTIEDSKLRDIPEKGHERWARETECV